MSGDQRGRRALQRRGVMRVVVLLAMALVIMQGFVGANSVRVAFVDSNQDRRVLEELRHAYEAAVPQGRLELVGVSSGELERLLPQWLVTGEKADVFLISAEIAAYAKGLGGFVGLGNVLLRSDTLRRDVEAFPEGMQQAFSHAGEPIGIPVTASVEVFQYNENLFRDAGLPPLRQMETDWTWHDMIDIGRFISAPQIGRYFIDMTLEFAVQYFLAHGDVISADGRQSLAFNPENVGILGLAQQAIHSDRISLPIHQQQNSGQRFSRGQLAVRPVSIASMQPAAVARNAPQWASFNWDVAIWPRSPYTGLRPGYGEAKALVVPIGTPNLPGALELLTFAASQVGQAAVIRSGEAFPARSDLWDEILATDASPPANRAAFAAAMRDWQLFTFPLVTLDQVDRLIMPLGAVLAGQMTPEEGLAAANREFDFLLQQQ